MADDNGRRSPTWAWLAGVLLVVVMALVSWWAANHDRSMQRVESRVETMIRIEERVSRLEREVDLLLGRRWGPP